MRISDWSSDVCSSDRIAQVLRDILPGTGRVLEIASGSGEHVVHFAGLFPHLSWQPSDTHPDALTSISGWTRTAGLSNIAPPIRLDAPTVVWGLARVDAILCINMVQDRKSTRLNSSH